MSKFCAMCGTKAEDEQRFCAKCGYNMMGDAPADPQQPTSQYAPPQQPAPQYAPPQQPGPQYTTPQQGYWDPQQYGYPYAQKKAGNKTKLVVILSVAAIVLAGAIVAAVLLLGGGVVAADPQDLNGEWAVTTKVGNVSGDDTGNFLQFFADSMEMDGVELILKLNKNGKGTAKFDGEELDATLEGGRLKFGGEGPNGISVEFDAQIGQKDDVYTISGNWKMVMEYNDTKLNIDGTWEGKLVKPDKK